MFEINKIYNGEAYETLKTFPDKIFQCCITSPCACEDSKIVPCLVLDPFMGAGTTGLVARKLGRSYVGIDLSADYVKMANKRINSI